MPILNYTTTVSVSKTVAEIQETLAKAGARAIIIEYGSDREPEAIHMEIIMKEFAGQIFSYRMPNRWQGVYASLQKSSTEKRYKTEEQAKRVAWRIVKDWCEAQLAIIEAGAAEVTEVFLPYMIDVRTNQTIYENFKRGLQLGPGEVVDAD